jgi:galactitol-specific phosphotransferase system IIC component
MLFLPGNHTLIFGAIADWAWIISPIAVMMGGDILRILIVSGVVMIPVYLWTSTYVGPIISGAAAAVGQALPEGVNTLTWFGTPPLNWALLKIANLNLESVAWAVGVAVLFVLASRLMPRWNNKAKERLIAEGKIAPAAVAEAASD